MLQELSIKNFAIIDDLHVLFSEGLTVISGETGAGKSIIINAFNLILGSRATSKLIREGAQSAELEALFKITPESKVGASLEKIGFGFTDQLLIQRVITINNRHRTYINGHIATIQTLNLVTENLASISGQHAYQGLLKEDRHLFILDQFGGLVDLRNEVGRCYNKIMLLIEKLENLEIQSKSQSEHICLLEFQKKEINDACIQGSKEDEQLENERNLLKNSELLSRIIHQSIEDLYSSNGAVAEKLFEIRKKMDRASQIDPLLSDHVESLGGCAFKIEDIAEELRAYLNGIAVDDMRLEVVEERLNILNKLKRKYGGTLDEVLSYLANINNELLETENISEKIDQIRSELERLHIEIANLAINLSKKRGKTAHHLAKKIEQELSTLKMTGTKFKLSLNRVKADKTTPPFLVAQGSVVNETGIDKAAFLMSPNVGEALKPLTEIASGGELSRVVLAIKAILAETGSVETIVFDEVDSGVGGSVAEVVGKKLRLLSRFHQIICITHLPQIARFGDYHYKISKHVENGRTVTSIASVSNEERIKELARMMGGEKITKATIDHAKEMLDSF